MRTKEASLAVPLLGILVLVVSLWVATPYLIEHVLGITEIAQRGQYGDQFGYANALFTGLGFVGVVATFYVQFQEIQRQGAEIAMQQALQRQTVNALLDAMHARSFDKIYDILDKKEVLEARKVNWPPKNGHHGV